jgi:hypothetical protein
MLRTTKVSIRAETINGQRRDNILHEVHEWIGKLCMSLHLVFKKLQAEGESARMNCLMDGYKHTKLKQSLVHCIGVAILVTAMEYY